MSTDNNEASQTAGGLQLIDALRPVATDKRIDTLRGVAETGSISQAARKAGISYKAAWQALDTLTNLAGVPLVEKAVGGSGGGGATLTAAGSELLLAAEALDHARQEVMRRFTGVVAGSTALAVRTSMRNQLPATIEGMVRQGAAVRVSLRLADGRPLAARVTQESVELLGLTSGQSVIALCKASAVRMQLAEDSSRADKVSVNQLWGTVQAIAEGDSLGDEVQMRVGADAQGLLLVGVAPQGSGLRVASQVWAVIDEVALVIALPA